MSNKSFVFTFSPKSPSQKEAQKEWLTNDLLFLLGPAGTGKSFTSLALALGNINQGKQKKIILTRALVTAGEEIGFLPGDVDEKTAPFKSYLGDILPKMSYKLPEGLIEFVPLAYMQGRTFEDSIIIVSEAQNLTYQQLKMVLTRIGKGSKCIVEGDEEQSFLRTGGDELLNVVEKLEGNPSVCVIDFDENVILRHSLVALVLKNL